MKSTITQPIVPTALDVDARPPPPTKVGLLDPTDFPQLGRAVALEKRTPPRILLPQPDARAGITNFDPRRVEKARVLLASDRLPPHTPAARPTATQPTRQELEKRAVLGETQKTVALSLARRHTIHLFDRALFIKPGHFEIQLELNYVPADVKIYYAANGDNVALLAAGNHFTLQNLNTLEVTFYFERANGTVEKICFKRNGNIWVDGFAGTAPATLVRDAPDAAAPQIKTPKRPALNPVVLNSQDLMRAAVGLTNISQLELCDGAYVFQIEPASSPLGSDQLIVERDTSHPWQLRYATDDKLSRTLISNFITCGAQHKITLEFFVGRNTVASIVLKKTEKYGWSVVSVFGETQVLPLDHPDVVSLMTLPAAPAPALVLEIPLASTQAPDLDAAPAPAEETAPVVEEIVTENHVPPHVISQELLLELVSQIENGQPLILPDGTPVIFGDRAKENEPISFGFYNSSLQNFIAADNSDAPPFAPVFVESAEEEICLGELFLGTFYVHGNLTAIRHPDRENISFVVSADTGGTYSFVATVDRSPQDNDIIDPFDAAHVQSLTNSVFTIAEASYVLAKDDAGFYLAPKSYEEETPAADVVPVNTAARLSEPDESSSTDDIAPTPVTSTSAQSDDDGDANENAEAPAPTAPEAKVKAKTKISEADKQLLTKFLSYAKDPTAQPRGHKIKVQTASVYTNNTAVNYDDALKGHDTVFTARGTPSYVMTGFAHYENYKNLMQLIKDGNWEESPTAWRVSLGKQHWTTPTADHELIALISKLRKAALPQSIAMTSTQIVFEFARRAEALRDGKSILISRSKVPTAVLMPALDYAAFAELQQAITSDRLHIEIGTYAPPVPENYRVIRDTNAGGTTRNLMSALSDGRSLILPENFRKQQKADIAFITKQLNLNFSSAVPPRIRTQLLLKCATKWVCMSDVTQAHFAHWTRGDWERLQAQLCSRYLRFTSNGYHDTAILDQFTHSPKSL